MTYTIPKPDYLKRLSIGLTILCLCISTPVMSANQTQALPLYSTTYDASRDAFKDGADAIDLATRTQRRILIELGGDWCKWCHQMDAFFDNNPDLKQQLHDTFVILRINVSDSNDNAEFLRAFPKPLGYPHMYVSEYNGKVLWSQDTAEFLRNGRYSREAFQAFFQRWRLTKSTITSSQ